MKLRRWVLCDYDTETGECFNRLYFFTQAEARLTAKMHATLVGDRWDGRFQLRVERRR